MMLSKHFTGIEWNSAASERDKLDIARAVQNTDLVWE